MLVAGNDRVQTIITQLEDSCRVTKVRGSIAGPGHLKPPRATWSLGWLPHRAWAWSVHTGMVGEGMTTNPFIHSLTKAS